MENKGKFQPGNPGGPGRPKKEREARFMEITLSVVTFEDWKEIVQKAVAQAKRGDATARKWLGDYLVGVPTQRTEITGKDGGPVEFDYVKLVTSIAPRPDGDN